MSDVRHWWLDARGLTSEENASAMRLMVARNNYDRAVDRHLQAKADAVDEISRIFHRLEEASRESDESFEAVCSAEDAASERVLSAVTKR